MTSPATAEPRRRLEGPNGAPPGSGLAEAGEQACRPVSPFFILGAPRSGTSLLSRMLNQHRRIAVPGETKAFVLLDRLLPLYGDLADPGNLARLIDDLLSLPSIRELQPPPDRAALLGALERSDFGGVFDALLKSWACARGKARWGEKTPGNAMHWQSIHGYFPDASVIHVLRDGRDVARSLQAAPFGPKTTYMAAARWADYVARVRAIGRDLPVDRYLEVRYEDLLARPEQTLVWICGFLGEAFDEQMLRFHENSDVYDTDDVNRRNLARPLLVGNSAKWRTSMSRTEIRVFEAVAGDWLALTGYPASLDHARMPAFERLYRRYGEHPPRKLWAMIKNRRGHREAQARLRIMLRRTLGALLVAGATGRDGHRQRTR
jgi:hypothetical protein